MFPSKPDLLEEMLRLSTLLSRMVYYFNDKEGLVGPISGEAVPKDLPIGTIIYNHFDSVSKSFLIVHKHQNGLFMVEKAHTRDIKKMRAALLIHGVSTLLMDYPDF